MNGDGLPDVLDETYYVSGTTVLTAVGLELQSPPLPDFKGVIAPFNASMSPGGSVVIPVTVSPKRMDRRCRRQRFESPEWNRADLHPNCR